MYQSVYLAYPWCGTAFTGGSVNLRSSGFGLGALDQIHAATSQFYPLSRSIQRRVRRSVILEFRMEAGSINTTVLQASTVGDAMGEVHLVLANTPITVASQIFRENRGRALVVDT